MFLSQPRILLALLFSAMAQAKPSRPETRFNRWQSLTLNVQEAAKRLGYSEGRWNQFRGNLERFNSFDTLPRASERDVLIILGTSSVSRAAEQWDCWVNHYRAYSWGDLRREGVQRYYRDLGWNRERWEGSDDEPDSEDKSWGDLTDDEKTAAGELCYVQWSWQNNEIPNGVSGSALCFSSVNQVQVRDKGLLPMDQIKIGDDVMTGSGDYSRIYSFSHYDPLLVVKYLQIYVSGARKPLEISNEHMVSVNNQMRRASEVRVGDQLGNLLVEKITSVQRQGAYAPVTESGDIVVSGVLASCYIAMLDHAPVDQHFGTHALLSPLRLMCAIDFGFCENETYTSGYSNWIYHVMKVAQYVNKSCGPILQAVVSFAVWPVLASTYLWVEVLMNPLLLLAASVGVALYWRRSKRSHIKLH